MLPISKSQIQLPKLSNDECFSERLAMLMKALNAPLGYGSVKWIKDFSGVTRVTAAKWQTKMTGNKRPEKDNMTRFAQGLLNHYDINASVESLEAWLIGAGTQEHTLSIPNAYYTDLARILKFGVDLFESQGVSMDDDKEVLNIVFSWVIEHDFHSKKTMQEEELRQTYISALNLAKQGILT